MFDIGDGCMFAPELIDMIIGYLHDSYDDLKSCALVSNTWHPSARVHLFHAIHLHHRTANALDRACRRLCECVQENPSLVALVRDLSIYWSAEVASTVVQQIPFTHLRTFALDRISWSQVSEDLMLDTREIFRLPSLREAYFRSLIFDHAKHLAIIMDGCRQNVKHLEFTQVAFLQSVSYKETVEVPLDERHCAQLESLAIIGGSASQIAEWALQPNSPLDLSGLKSLSYSDKECCPPLGSLLQASSASLERLQIRSSLSESAARVDISDAVLPRLVRLTITDITEKTLKQTIHWLSKFTAASRVEQFVFKVYAHVDVQRIGWADLDTCLDLLGLLHLKKITLIINQPMQQAEELEILRQSLERSFPKMVGRQLLEIL